MFKGLPLSKVERLLGMRVPSCRSAKSFALAFATYLFSLLKGRHTIFNFAALLVVLGAPPEEEVPTLALL